MARLSPHEQAEAVRRSVGEVENHLIDELRSERIGRREFMRRGTALGISISALGTVIAGCARPDVTKVSPPQTQAPKPGGTIRAGIVSPAAAIDPITISDEIEIPSAVPRRMNSRRPIRSERNSSIR